jgi:hypothetical protein
LTNEKEWFIIKQKVILIDEKEGKKPNFWMEQGNLLQQ